MAHSEEELTRLIGELGTEGALDLVHRLIDHYELGPLLKPQQLNGWGPPPGWGQGPPYDLPEVSLTITGIREGWRIQAIKVIRDHLGLSLRECANGTDRFPWTLVKCMHRQQAETLKRALEDVQATVELGRP